tara:strand:+ start:868 stop:1302 length:435 start_codon:yes stop_codon:yes gene_type:complete
MDNKEYKRIVSKIREMCGFDFLDKRKTNNYVEARAVLYKMLEMDRLNTQHISNIILKNDKKFFNRTTIRHSLLNFEVYYTSSEFVRKLYHTLDGYDNLERKRTKLESLISEVDIDKHQELFVLVKERVDIWKRAIDQDKKYFFN